MIETLNDIQNLIKNKSKNIPQHFWAIHRRLWRKNYDALTLHERFLIANEESSDLSNGINKHNEFVKQFCDFIIQQTAKVFLDPEKECNLPYSWKISKKVY